MKPARRTGKYLFLLLLVIGAGLLSRRVAGVPLMVGDMLYAVMMYVIVRFFFRSARALIVAAVSAGICYAIEISQLCHPPLLLAIRRTPLGGLVLGQGFLWSDLAAYTLGVLLCVAATGVVRQYREWRRSVKAKRKYD
ncbi:DUF2809 domain-containing protein [Pontibacter sp. 172403-2]|uniref:ribosomal maturation YjgA family protein n=1 Tax=Pontibacter rufus TaxID=2791028 RepID=UPI001E404913|nr:DUF2809 domain-containing protein [Pontibacter sp. 172403-2]